MSIKHLSPSMEMEALYIQQMHQIKTLEAELAKRDAENKRLVSMLSDLSQQIKTEQRLSFREERNALKAEVERLRNALQSIAKMDINCTHTRWKALARKALEKK